MRAFACRALACAVNLVLSTRITPSTWRTSHSESLTESTGGESMTTAFRPAPTSRYTSLNDVVCSTAVVLRGVRPLVSTASVPAAPGSSPARSTS